MATDPERGPDLEADDLVRALADAYGFTEAAIIAEIRLVLQAGVTPRRRNESLRTIDELLARLGSKTDPLARRAVRKGADEGEAQTGRLVQGIVATPDADDDFSRVNARAVRELQASMIERLADGRRRIGRSAADVYARESRRSVMLGLLGDKGSRRAVSRDLVNRLAREGVTGFTDKAGRRWGIRRYAEMVARTTTREAVTAAAVGRMMSVGINVARVSVHGTKCDICRPLEGRLVLLGGEVPEGVDGRVWSPAELPGLSGMPPFHPNCKHSLVPEVVAIQALRREMAQAA